MGWWYLCFFVRRFGSLYTRRCQRGAVKGVIPALSSQYTSSSDQCIFGKILAMNQEWRLRTFFSLSSSSSVPSSSLARRSPPLLHVSRARERSRSISVRFSIGYPFVLQKREGGTQINYTIFHKFYTFFNSRLIGY